jgi:rubrerythrin
MNAMTADNLRSAFGGESQAHMRYLLWGNEAAKEGFSKVANLFAAIAYAEQIHAHGHFRVLKNETGDFLVPAGAGFGIAKTSDHLEWARNGELHEVEQMYPAFLSVAEAQDEKQAIRSMKFAIEAEKTHAELFLAAKSAVDAGADFEAAALVSVCPICGHTLAGEAKDACPVCGVKAEKYEKFKA